MSIVTNIWLSTFSKVDNGLEVILMLLITHQCWNWMQVAKQIFLTQAQPSFHIKGYVWTFQYDDILDTLSWLLSHWGIQEDLLECNSYVSLQFYSPFGTTHTHNLKDEESWGIYKEIKSAQMQIYCYYYYYFMQVNLSEGCFYFK